MRWRMIDKGYLSVMGIPELDDLFFGIADLPVHGREGTVEINFVIVVIFLIPSSGTPSMLFPSLNMLWMLLHEVLLWTRAT